MLNLHFWRLARALVLMTMLSCALCQPVLAKQFELSLDDCIKLTLQNNPALKVAEGSRGKSAWALKQAQAGKGFTLTASHTDNRYDTPPDTTSILSSLLGSNKYTFTNKFDNQLILGLTLYSGGEVEGKIDEAKLNLKVADFNIVATRQQMKLAATTAYFQVLQYSNELQIAQESVHHLEDHLETVKNQYSLGMVPKADSLYSQVQLATAQDSLIRIQNNYENAVDNLCTVIGLPMNSEIKIKESFGQQKHRLTIDECVEYAMKHQPQMASALTNIEIAKTDIKVAKSGYLPTVTFQGIQDWYDKNAPGNKNSNWEVILTTSMNILDSGLTKSQYHQAKSNLETVRQQTKQTTDQLVLDVRQNYHSMIEAEKRIKRAEQSVEQAQENYRISEFGYSTGMSSNSNVIDAELALYQAQTLRIEALYDYNNSKAKLNKAMGMEAQ